MHLSSRNSREESNTKPIILFNTVCQMVYCGCSIRMQTQQGLYLEIICSIMAFFLVLGGIPRRIKLYFLDPKDLLQG